MDLGRRLERIEYYFAREIIERNIKPLQDQLHIFNKELMVGASDLPLINRQFIREPNPDHRKKLRQWVEATRATLQEVANELGMSIKELSPPRVTQTPQSYLQSQTKILLKLTPTFSKAQLNRDEIQSILKTMKQLVEILQESPAYLVKPKEAPPAYTE